MYTHIYIEREREREPWGREWERGGIWFTGAAFGIGHRLEGGHRDVVCCVLPLIPKWLPNSYTLDPGQGSCECSVSAPERTGTNKPVEATFKGWVLCSRLKG